MTASVSAMIADQDTGPSARLHDTLTMPGAPRACRLAALGKDHGRPG